MSVSEVEETAVDLFNGPVADFYDEGIVKLMQSLDMCLNHSGGSHKRILCCIYLWHYSFWKKEVIFCL
jgi:hypothetical protein